MTTNEKSEIQQEKLQQDSTPSVQPIASALRQDLHAPLENDPRNDAQTYVNLVPESERRQPIIPEQLRTWMYLISEGPSDTLFRLNNHFSGAAPRNAVACKQHLEEVVATSDTLSQKDANISDDQIQTVQTLNNANYLHRVEPGTKKAYLALLQNSGELSRKHACAELAELMTEGQDPGKVLNAYKTPDVRSANKRGATQLKTISDEFICTLHPGLRDNPIVDGYRAFRSLRGTIVSSIESNSHLESLRKMKDVVSEVWPSGYILFPQASDLTFEGNARSPREIATSVFLAVNEYFTVAICEKLNAGE